jgi:hypothetical protein
MRKHSGMRPHDIVVLLKIVSYEDREWGQMDLAKSLHISQSEISEAFNRSQIAGLIDVSKRKIFKLSFIEFLIHGLKYVFPVRPGAIVRGIATAHSAEPLSNLISYEEDIFVWPYFEGDIRGQAIEPLYKNAPKAALEDRKLYDLLALVDALRVGRTREYKIASDQITRIIQYEEA